VGVRSKLYRFGPLTWLIRATLNIAAPVGLVETEVASGELAGLRFLLDMQSEKDYWLGTYEPYLQAAVREYVEPGMVAYDVGANIGFISMLLARVVGPGGRVFAFEALPINLERMNHNIMLNHLAERISVVPSAVTDNSDPVHFMVHLSSSMGKTVDSTGRDDQVYPQQITVSGVSLDEFVFERDHPAPDVIKMDIEGGEVRAFAGMKRILSEIHPILFVELHGSEAARIVAENMLSSGYQVRLMEPGYPVISSIDISKWKTYIVGIPDRDRM